MAAATKDKLFQRNKGDRIENLIRFLANFKAQMEYKKIDFNADKIKKYMTVTEAMNSASLKYLFFYSLFSNFP